MTPRSDRTSRPVLGRYAQLLVGCTVLGVGVALMLEAALGSDGYSTLVNGLTIASGLAFWQLNLLVGAVFVGLAWARGIPMAQVALAWVLHNPSVAAPIVGPTRDHHLPDAVAALAVELTEDEIPTLEEPYTPRMPSGY